MELEVRSPSPALAFPANPGWSVYRAVDRATGLPVVIKQARPHIGSTLSGSDVRDALRREASLLEEFSSQGIAPRKIALFEQQANTFLAEELVDGGTLRNWVLTRIVDDQGMAPADAVAVVIQLVDLLAIVHREGYVCRDFNPDNVMVDRSGQLRLRRSRSACPTRRTSCERLHRRLWINQPQSSVSLGAIIFFIATGIDPVLIPDQTTVRPERDRIAAWLGRIAVDNLAARQLRPLVLGLIHEEPRLRWDLNQVRAWLAIPHATSKQRATRSGGAALPAKDQERLLIDGLEYLLKTMVQRPAGSARFWPTPAADLSDPCNVQHGAAGVLAVLTRASGTLKSKQLKEAVRVAAEWTDQRWSAEPRILPGLYFGRSGTAWALYDAAQMLNDQGLGMRAATLAKQVPVNWPNPDICHGAAGAGMTQLHMWHATADPDFRDRAQQCADGLIAACERREEGVVWPIPADFDSELAGLTHYGFAHGVAGVGSFLLAAGLALNRADYVAMAREAGATLKNVAEIDGQSAWWPSGEDERIAKTRLTHWCSGSSGVGTFLIRLWQATDQQDFCVLTMVGGVGLRRGRRNAETLAVGDAVDFWRVEAFEPDRRLRLVAEMKVPGRAWLQFKVEPESAKSKFQGSTIRQTALFDPAGLSGLIYWYALYPIHRWIFAGMLRAIAICAELQRGATRQD